MFLTRSISRANAAGLESFVAVAGQDVSREFRAVRTEHPPALDGIVDDSWAGAASVVDFHQREPFEGRAPTEKTAVRILYDRHYLYFGIECFDSEPSRIVANEL